MASFLSSLGSRNKIPSGYRLGQIQQFTPEQKQLFQSLFQHVNPSSYLSQLAGGDPGAFEAEEAPALRQFSGLQGNLASRFSGMGLGARRSSGFQNTATQVASEFAQDLQSKRQELQRQAIRDLMGMGTSLLSQRPYEQFLTEKQPSTFSSLLGGLGSIGSRLGGEYGSLKLLKHFGVI
jgi:hypothetical protein